jgi:hypothetical protein
MKKFFVILLLVAAGCGNIQDAQPENRNSFVYFYPSTLNSTSVSAALDQDGGVVMIGYRSNSLIDLTNPTMVVIKTDARGKTVWQKEFTDAATDSLYGKAVKPVADGYLIAADNIKVFTDQNSNQVTTTKINIYKTDAQGNVVFTYIHKPLNSLSYTVNAINTDEQENVIVLGTRGTINRLSVLLLFTPTANGYTLAWEEEFDLQTLNYTNGRAVQITANKNVIWASSITEVARAKSYGAFPLVEPGSTFANSRLIGENDDVNNLVVSDLQKNNLGFASVGTNYTILTGTTTANKNFFFARLGNDGNIVSTSYYDDGTSINATDPANLSKPEFNTLEDGGLAVAPGQDGSYLLVGYLESRPAIGGQVARGNGGRDVSLIKIDAFGSVQWYKTYGGIGDEVANSAFQATDGGFIITGTSTVQGFASMFVMKVNANGELSN